MSGRATSRRRRCAWPTSTASSARRREPGLALHGRLGRLPRGQGPGARARAVQPRAARADGGPGSCLIPGFAPGSRCRVDCPVGAARARHGAAVQRRLFRASRPGEPRRVPYDKFLYPLDGITDWNRLYGRRGFFQHQSVVPDRRRRRTRSCRSCWSSRRGRGQGSFLVVLKLVRRRAPRPASCRSRARAPPSRSTCPNRGPGHAAPARPDGRGRAEGRRPALSRQGRHHDGRTVPRRLPALARGRILSRPRPLVGLLAARHRRPLA